MEDYIVNSTILLESERKSIKLIEPLVWQLKDKLHLPNEIIYNILIATTEAVNNAIIHGNKLTEGKIVIFIIQATNELITVSVEDQGSGENIVDPRNPDNLMKEGGRGVFLIKALTDECCFQEEGRKVIMKFNINRPMN
jgi:serine/threonine-protein kinase RsbW